MAANSETTDWPARRRFRWASGVTVGLRATPAAAGWLDGWADVLGLPPLGDESVDVLVEIDGPGDPGALAPPAASAWTADGDGAAGYPLHGLAVWEHPQHPHVAVRIVIEPNERHRIHNRWSLMHPLYRCALRRGGLPVHAALAAWRGRGVILAAPGGTGKSTTLRRLPDSWERLGDDELLLVPVAGGWRLHPLPTWSNFLLGRRQRTWASEHSVPLAGICFLQQAAELRFEELAASRGAVLLHQAARQLLSRGWDCGGYEDPATMKAAALDVAAAVAARVPMTVMHLPLTGDFWSGLQAWLERFEAPEASP